MDFPKSFVWGAASSSYQIEGAPFEDGKVASVWDTFCKKEGAIIDGTSGDVACDSYHRAGDDISHLKQLGVGAYRFSICWPRIITDLSGTVNDAGLAYYDALVDGLLEAGIAPYVTLFHWEMPQYLEDIGGWLCRESVEAFMHYTRVVVSHFKGRVKHYFTLNEPQCVVHLGLSKGVHAPGKQLGNKDCYAAVHNLLLAHGASVRTIRESDPEALVGFASTGQICYPHTSVDAEGAAAEMFRHDVGDFFSHSLFLDPIVLGRYPDSALPFLPEGATQELPLISEPLDFLGANIYNGNEIAAGDYVPRYDGFPRTAIKWPVTPECLGFGSAALCGRYGLPLFITENGLSCNDRIYADGRVHDLDRIEFLQDYLQSLAGAIKKGADVRGYFHWSLTDNFEWHNGYSERFGLVYVDFRNGNRILKDSAYWYKALVQNGSLPPVPYPARTGE